MTLATIQGADILAEGDGSYVTFTADADIDADGANGQNGAQAAYMVDDHGSEHLANGGMKMIGGGRVGWAADWGKDIVFVGRDGLPEIGAGGVVASMTSYKFPGKRHAPDGQVDAETVPYIVVPPIVLTGIAPIVLGCKASVTWRGKTVDAVVADVGPRSKVGELSIAAARALGMNPSPRTGGVESFDVKYELWPGVAAPGFVLMRSNGTYA